MLVRRSVVTTLTVASLAFGCEQGNEREAMELAQVCAVAGQVVEDVTRGEGALLFLVGSTLKAPLPRRNDDAPPPRSLEPNTQIIGQLLCDVPEAGAKAGDRVVFRPDHPDWSRRCVVMHSTDGKHFISALEQGTLEVISTSLPADDDHRTRLLGLLRHPLTQLALVS